MTTRSLFVSLIACLFVSSAVAQEVLFPLSCNPVIREYVKKNPVRHHQNLRTSSSALPLPFVDDFSGQGIFPDIQLWEDSDAFINQTYCDDPVTIGVATLDGIDKEGNPHDSNSTSSQPVICDYLTSLPIDLSAATAADSVYFSFYYQPQGFGDEPEDGDSLVLQFYALVGVDSNWINIWVANGAVNSPFTEVRIRIEDVKYLWGGFQFRFYNYANPNGNRDHWNIDYVSINANESAAEPLKEISLVYPIQSYLKEFTSMPYSHYKSEVKAGRNPVKDSIVDYLRIHTFTGAGTSLNYFDTVRTRTGAVIFGSQVTGSLNPSFYTTETFKIGLAPQLFDTVSGHMTDFNILHTFTGVKAGEESNDTSYMTQHFYNYYAYDDGTAESATGVHVANTKMAYQFDVKMEDSLLGIQIYFNPWGKNIHLDYFSICLWSSINVSANTETLVYQEFNLVPRNNDSINGFTDYYFSTPLHVSPGTNYIGLVQNSVNEIGLGVDHNIDSHDKMFLNYNNQWYNSTITGSWMMRPIFGKMLSIGVDELASGNSYFEVYPSPASDELKITSRNFGGIVDVSIHNLLGEKVNGFRTAGLQQPVAVDVSSLANGIYVVRFQPEGSQYFEAKKFVVHR